MGKYDAQSTEGRREAGGFRVREGRDKTRRNLRDFGLS